MAEDEIYPGSVKHQVSKLFEESLEAIIPTIPAPPELDVAALIVPIVLACSPSKDSDYQCNNALSISSKLNGDNDLRLALAQAIMQNFPNSQIIRSCSVGGNGYVNVVFSNNWIANTIKKMLVEGIETWAPRLEIERAVVDFPSPNIAKELHVGHLRSCVIGDAIARLLEFSNVEVLRRNHVGDWGTQFGKLLELLFEENLNWDVDGELTLHDLDVLYKKASVKFKEDQNFKERARKSVVRLQSGDAKYVKAWEKIREISRGACNEVFVRLGVQSEEMGESFYSPYIPEVLEALSDQVKDDKGTRVIFSERILLGEKGTPSCLLVVKKDGGYSYDTTDLAALWYRVKEEKADWIIYVTDIGQKAHFQMVFEAAERAGWLAAAGSDLCSPKVVHVGFGLVQGEDGKRFKTRDSEVPRLVDLLDEAKACSRKKILELIEKNKASDEWSEDEVEQTAEKLGCAAIKYADLKNNISSNYKFNPVKMISLVGNTALFLVKQYTRALSIIKSSDRDMRELKKTGEMVLIASSERELGLHLIRFTEILEEALSGFKLHVLCDYLYQLASKFHIFYLNYKVCGSAEETSRLLLCEAITVVMKKCFDLLGIEPPARI